MLRILLVGVVLLFSYICTRCKFVLIALQYQLYNKAALDQRRQREGEADGNLDGQRY